MTNLIRVTVCVENWATVSSESDDFHIASMSIWPLSVGDSSMRNKHPADNN